MLKENFKENDIIVLRLNTGEEVIGRFKRNESGTITITKPAVLHAVPHNNQVGLGLAPFMFGVDETGEFPFSQSSYSVVLKARKEAADMYTQATSNIVPANTGFDASKLSL